MDNENRAGPAAVQFPPFAPETRIFLCRETTELPGPVWRPQEQAARLETLLEAKLQGNRLPGGW